MHRLMDRTAPAAPGSPALPGRCIFSARSSPLGGRQGPRARLAAAAEPRTPNLGQRLATRSRSFRCCDCFRLHSHLLFE